MYIIICMCGYSCMSISYELDSYLNKNSVELLHHGIIEEAGDVDSPKGSPRQGAIQWRERRHYIVIK